MNIYLAHTEDMLPEYAENVLVRLASNNDGIQHYAPGNCPEPSEILAKWLKDNCADDVYIGHYEPIVRGFSVSHFEVHFWFADSDQALMFKLAWAGL